MRTLILEGVRCFRDEQQIPIRPITLLVGENSTGKSTVLAMVRAAWDVAFRGGEPDFNEEPFDLGGYNTIAHYHGGQGRRVQGFSIGSHFQMRERSRPSLERRVTGTFEDRAGQPALVGWEATQDDLVFRVRWTGDGSGIADFELSGKKVLEDAPIDSPRRTKYAYDAFFAAERRILERSADRSKGRGGDHDVLEAVRRLHAFLPPAFAEPRPVSSAPIRSRPKRTYDPRRELPEPEGSHVPMQLATLHATDHDAFDRLAKAIQESRNMVGKPGFFPDWT